ncbi:transcriptional regulator [Cronobacter malonaticus]|uniref:transcriptional regulator n=1 Tax=Cronobacter TaxID=413496 RepID=UPI000A10EE91|nr:MULTISPECIES: YdaS family helix-turn-helix protein [Cronobacter]ELY6202324.1 helix-turn-helix domain-containing protein [Cronobacter malonaticus]ELY6256199.1 helix-turn-helix domain-containing protein [Cronobacter malonaticus]NCG99800.1 Rha family transcriptional regulator [Cronobacter malonaticus]NCH50146.1 Rha family transcriptional regulator [Cronobacter malonaticus]
MTGFERAIKIVGNGAALGRLVGRSKMTISNWKKNGVPPDFVRVVFDLTGVTPHELRPDLYPNPSDAICSEEKNNTLSDRELNHENQA